MDKFIKADPVELNLLYRLHELPKAAFERISAAALGISARRFKAIMYGQVKSISESELRSFARFLRCSQSEFLNPEYIFTDFRTKKQVQEDLMNLEKIA